MKKVFAILLLFFNIIYVQAQCAIDYNYIPIGVNYGLSTDTLATGNVGQMYDEDITFFLPTDTVDNGLYVTFVDFHIISISYCSLFYFILWSNTSLSGCSRNSRRAKTNRFIFSSFLGEACFTFTVLCSVGKYERIEFHKIFRASCLWFFIPKMCVLWRRKH